LNKRLREQGYAGSFMFNRSMPMDVRMFLKQLLRREQSSDILKDEWQASLTLDRAALISHNQLYGAGCAYST